MPTLEQAASQLGIAEKTLRRWLRLVDPPIEPTRDKRNLRYRFITEEEVERIRDARATITDLTTGSSGPPPPHDRLSYGKLDDDRSKSGEGRDSEVSLMMAPTSRWPRQQPEHLFVLPEGMMSRTEAADRHGIPRSNLRRWVEQGHIEVSDETYAGAHGQFSVAQPLTARGLAQLYALAHRKPYFLPCESCPHSEKTEE